MPFVQKVSGASSDLFIYILSIAVEYTKFIEYIQVIEIGGRIGAALTYNKRYIDTNIDLCALRSKGSRIKCSFVTSAILGRRQTK